MLCSSKLSTWAKKLSLCGNSTGIFRSVDARYPPPNSWEGVTIKYYKLTFIPPNLQFTHSSVILCNFVFVQMNSTLTQISEFDKFNFVVDERLSVYVLSHDNIYFFGFSFEFFVLIVLLFLRFDCFVIFFIPLYLFFRSFVSFNAVHLVLSVVCAFINICKRKI